MYLACDHTLNQVNLALKGDVGLVGSQKSLDDDQVLPDARQTLGNQGQILLKVWSSIKAPQRKPSDNEETHKATKQVMDLLRKHNPFTREKAQLITVLFDNNDASDEMVHALT